MKGILTGRDIEPLIKLSAELSGDDGHMQFSILVGALVCMAQQTGIQKEILHRAIDVAFDYDGTKLQAPINLFDH